MHYLGLDIGDQKSPPLSWMRTAGDSPLPLPDAKVDISTICLSVVALIEQD